MEKVLNYLAIGIVCITVLAFVATFVAACLKAPLIVGIFAAIFVCAWAFARVGELV